MGHSPITRKIRTNRDRHERARREGTADLAVAREHIHRHRWEIKQLIRKYSGRCVLCGEQVNLIHDDPRQATRDHIIPLSKGGRDTFDNLQLACSQCNQAKGATLPDTDTSL